MRPASGPHGSPGDAKHRPETAQTRLLTMRVVTQSGHYDTLMRRSTARPQEGRSARLVDALAETLDQTKRARGPAFTATAEHLDDARLDRIDQLLRSRAQHQDEFIEFFEPAHLEEFWPRHVEDEGGDADAQEL